MISQIIAGVVDVIKRQCLLDGTSQPEIRKHVIEDDHGILAASERPSKGQDVIAPSKVLMSVRFE